jgi:hypothetical protein
MFTAQQITRAMKVRDTTGLQIGIVDHVDEDGIGLSQDGFSDGLHHFVPLAAVARIDGDNIVVEPGQATSVEAVEGAILYARRRSARADQPGSSVFRPGGQGTSVGASEY